MIVIIKRYIKPMCLFILFFIFSYSSLACAETNLKSFYGRAQEAFSQGQYNKAIKEYDKILSFGEADQSLLYQIYIYRGSSYLAIGQRIPAIDDFTKAARINDSSNPSYVYFLLGNAYKEQKNYTEAINQYGKIIKLKQDSDSLYQAYISRGTAYQAMGKMDKALEDFTRASEINDRPDPVYIHLVLGNFYNVRKEYGKAIEQYNKVISLKPNSNTLYQAYISRGTAYQTMGKMDKALEDFTRALEINDRPDPAYAYFLVSNIYNVRKEYGKAIEQYNKVISLKPNSNTLYQAYISRGTAYQTMGKMDKALEDFTRALEINDRPDPAYAYFLVSNIYNVRKEYGKAIEQYNKVISLKPNSNTLYQAYISRGAAYQTMGKMDKALEDFTRASEINDRPDPAYIHLVLGNFYSFRNEYGKAIEHYDKAISLKTNSNTLYQAYIGRSQIFFARKQFSLSIDDLRKAMSIESVSKQLSKMASDTYCLYGNQYKRTGQYQFAISMYTAAIEIDPQNASSYRGRGFAHVLMGNRALALSDLQKACELGDKKGCNIMDEIKHMGRR